ncbi:repressor LexA [Candidatus Woesebacteria bacterium RIFCSPHIGHO2_01_FULL_39_28]|uniref:LexA repressor n=1 Tax=Candidatus Woesebacteria bacterium RIFCSPHIGHO2_01_FULL_39_28 TaxID=1802496 RepID=A0A1F7YAN3_9BACT|nr:MAG: repressor LexA [Candidatus Doudnabacteria bacterium RIFCSPHIGHO2_02_FULL_43_13b]OGM24397.1 MAG: repressor LexA [Candidatus Woesebacteria bacterium RIFCSPHIGHO2_01_FULL_39_28]
MNRRSSRNKMITKRQKQVIDFIKSFSGKRGYAPSLEEIKKHLRLSSVSTAHHHVKKLQAAGLIYKVRNQPRALSPKKEIRNIEIPILGSIAAGKPIEALELKGETVSLSQGEISPSGKHYALRVRGDSMIEEGIFDGDIVVIRSQPTADNGQTVVAIIDDNQATLKKIFREKDKIRLQPANKNLRPFFRKKVEVRGVVEKIIRTL